MPDPIEPDETEQPETPDETPKDESPDEDEPESEAPESLGDPGKRALDAMKAKEKAARQKLREAQARIRELETPKEGEPTPEQIRAEASREATEKANLRIVRSDVKAVAATLLRNPADAAAFLDLSQFDVDDDGETDEDEIRSAIQNLIAERPYLAIDKNLPGQSGKRRVPEVPADPANKQSTPVSHADRVKAAKAAGDWKSVIALENELLESK